MTINTSLQTPVFVSLGMMLKTRLKTLLYFRISDLNSFTLLCAELQDLTKVERPKF